MYDAVLFDMDGVLVEPTDPDTAREAIHRAFADFDVDAAEQDVDDLLNVDADGVHRVCRRHGLDADDFWRARERRIQEAQTRAFDDGGKQTYPDVDAVHDLAGHRLALVSNNQQPTVDHVVDGLGFDGRFEAVRGRGPRVDDLSRKKPSPDNIERTLSELDVDDAVYIGDREKDVVAAGRADVDSALVRRDHNTDLEPSTEPTYDLDGLDEVTELLEEETP